MLGVPGGYEWLVILVVALVLFVPGIVVFSAGYWVGKRVGERDAREDLAEDAQEAHSADGGESSASETQEGGSDG